MGDRRPDQMTDEALRQEHRALQSRLDVLLLVRQRNAVASAGTPTARSRAGEQAQIEAEMAAIRRRQRALYEAHRRRRLQSA